MICLIVSCLTLLLYVAVDSTSPSATGNEEKEIYLEDIYSLLVKIQKDETSMKRYREDTEIQDLKRFCEYLVCNKQYLI